MGFASLLQAKARFQTNSYAAGDACSTWLWELRDVKDLLDGGVLTPAEFEALKARLLNGT